MFITAPFRSLQSLLDIALQVTLGIHAYHFFDDPPVFPDKEGDRNVDNIPVIFVYLFVRPYNRKDYAELLDHGKGIRVIQGYGNHHKAFVPVCQKHLLKTRHFIRAGKAPACPEIKEYDLAPEI